MARQSVPLRQPRVAVDVMPAPLWRWVRAGSAVGRNLPI